MKNSEYVMRDLKLVRQLNLTHWYIAAGYVRNRVWDHLHGHSMLTPLNDIDVIFYDHEHIDEDKEKELENWLNQQTNSSIWSVKNQARMHLKNNDKPYNSITDAISRWPETVTAVGITLSKDDVISIIAPYGLEDLFNLRVRRSPLFKDQLYYQKRVAGKEWSKKWPKLHIDWN
ncbi:nucleotidyltransferase family protein [Paenibacillus lemnae]|uniref:Nucleotidyltransferase family protein n=1 Tax=Paenibacillus lemnae TaxID=1330551 RepID=A0A848MBS8_PAELE|nr:nucleotidyltransferase family protein [Paenibacillus lemnae]NMO97689.1 nucleotidyltransferase family protein [Paenibacillus lemnae]